MPRLIVVALCWSLAVTPAWAHRPGQHHSHGHPPGHSHPHDHGPETVEVEVTIPPAQAGEPSSAQLQEMLHEAHEALESESPDEGFFQRWLNKFNYKKILLNAYRWYLLKSGQMDTRDHALNLVLMFLASHTLETAGGLALAAAGIDPETHWLLRGIYTTVGVGITIPGLDPLCIALFALYMKRPHAMNAIFHLPRVAIVRSTSFLAKYSGIQAVVQWMVRREDGAKFLEETLSKGKPGTYVFRATVEGYEFAIFGEGARRAATLEMRRHGETALAVTSLAIPRDRTDAAARKDLSHLLKPFGWNVRDAVLEAFDAAATGRREWLAERAYVEKIDESETEWIIRFKVPAIQVGARTRVLPWEWLKAGVRTCGSWLASWGNSLPPQWPTVP